MHVAVVDTTHCVVYDTVVVTVEGADELMLTVGTAGRQVLVRGAGGHALALYDAAGRPVGKKETAVDATAVFPVSVPGVYLLRVDGGTVHKVVVP